MNFSFDEKKKINQKNNRKTRPLVQENFIQRLDIEKEIIAPHIFSFNANLAGGNFIILAGKPERVGMKVQWFEGARDTDYPKLYLEGNSVQLKATSFLAFIKQKNAYIIEITLPTDTSVSIKMTAGTLYIDGLRGELDVGLKFGEVCGNVYSKKSKVTMIAGNIQLHHLGGSVEAMTRVGDVELLFDAVSPNDKITASSWAGDIRMKFPCGFLSPTGSRKLSSGKINNTMGVDVAAVMKLGDIYADDEISPRNSC